MFYMDNEMPEASRNGITQFLGYNHTHYTNQGEFYDMKNLCSDEYPLLKPRALRNCIVQLNDSTWRDIETEIQTFVEGDISEKVGTYTSSIEVNGGKTTIHIDTDVDFSYVDGAVLYKAVFYKGAEKVREESKSLIGSGTQTFSFEYLSDDVTRIGITYVCTASDPASFDNDTVVISRQHVQKMNDNVRGMVLKDGKIAYFVGTHLYYNGYDHDMYQYMTGDDGNSDVQMLNFGAYILVFPLGLYLNTLDHTYGSLGAEYTFPGGKTITYHMCNVSGADIDTPTAKPSNPRNGDYWLDTTVFPNALYRWSDTQSMWVGMASTYIKISFETVAGLTGLFKEGDAVYMTSTVEHINEGSVIVKMADNYIVVKGILNEVKTQNTSSQPMSIKRKIPKLDFVTISNNRVWGCYRGRDENGEYLNEIHASKLGDPKNWYVFQGASTDSYTLSIGDDGDFTGCTTFQGYPIFFKENIVYRIYGAYPSAYQLYTYNVRGVQKGSHRSIAVVNEYLMYKSVSDVCVFDGSNPVSISDNLGNVKYFNAVGGSCLGKYYLSVVDEDDVPTLFVYDSNKKAWFKEDDLRIEEFAYNESGALYGRDKLSLYGFERATDLLGQTETISEEKVDWFAETSEMGMEVVGRKFIKGFNFRADIPEHSLVEVSISYNGLPFKHLANIRGLGRIETRYFNIMGRRTDTFRLRISGYGDCLVYAIWWDTEEGSEEE